MTGLVACGGSEGTTETVTVMETSEEAETSAADSAEFGDGTHRVGTDIEPGTYRTEGAPGCYWARLRSFSGELEAIIANANPSGPAVVTIAPTDAGFESTNCGAWSSLTSGSSSASSWLPPAFRTSFLNACNSRASGSTTLTRRQQRLACQCGIRLIEERYTPGELLAIDQIASTRKGKKLISDCIDEVLRR
jgi:hypothetical protein